jgi:hypothetical protein
MASLSNAEPRPEPRSDDEPSWAEKILEVLRRVFGPGARRPVAVPVPVSLPPAGGGWRRS